jgi:Flp pilus assembly protein TadG
MSLRSAMLFRSRQGHRSRGQSLAEFALVLPVFIALVGGIIQFGVLFWSQNTLTQVVRDTGRWAATRNITPCESADAALWAQADSIAANGSLWGHTSTEFQSPSGHTDLTTSNYTAGGDTAVNAYSAANSMAVAWVWTSGTTTCPPTDNSSVVHVTIRMNQQVPTFFPGMQFLPGLGTCDVNGCHIVLSSTAQFRMEPTP